MTDDNQLLKAIKAVIESGEANTSILQGKLSVGYGEATRLLETMESMGIVTPVRTIKKREIISTDYEDALNQVEIYKSQT